jgi:hypothetical protein
LNELQWFGRVLPAYWDDASVIVLSDLHYGNPYCSLKHFQRTVDFIDNTDNCVAFLNGDLLEAVTKSSKGDVYTQQLTPQQQRDDVIAILEPIADKIMGVTTGNHEQRIYNETGVDLSADIAKALKAPYRPEGMLFKMSIGSGNERHPDRPYVFWGYITHGYGGARTRSAKAVKAERLSTMLHADWYAMSHDHVVNAAPNVYLMPDNRGTVNRDGFLSGKVIAKREMLIKTNSYLKWGGYAEAGGFPPSDLATPLVQLLTPDSTIWEMYPDKARQAVKVVV